MTDDTGLLIAIAVYGLVEAVYYLTTAVATLAVVGLVGYWIALRKASRG